MPEREVLRTLSPELRRFWKAELVGLTPREQEAVTRTLVQHYGPVAVAKLLPKASRTA